MFSRAIGAPPIQMKVQEEVANGTEVGLIQCEDLDVGENAKIDYVISGTILFLETFVRL